MSKAATFSGPALKKKLKIQCLKEESSWLTWVFYDEYEIEHFDLNDLTYFLYHHDAVCAEQML